MVKKYILKNRLYRVKKKQTTISSGLLEIFHKIFTFYSFLNFFNFVLIALRLGYSVESGATH